MEAKKKKPCSGCLERNLPVAERKLHGSSQTALKDEVSRLPPIDKMMVVYIDHQPQHLVGQVTGQNYGWQRFGCVTVMATVDAKVDKRVLKATQETLLMVTK